LTFDGEMFLLRCLANKFNRSLIGLFPSTVLPQNFVSAWHASPSSARYWLGLSARDTFALQFSCLPIGVTARAITAFAVNENSSRSSFSWNNHGKFILALCYAPDLHLHGLCDYAVTWESNLLARHGPQFFPCVLQSETRGREF